MTLFYTALLLVLFYVLVVAEFFLPTGGMLGISSVVVLAAAIGIAFSHSLLAGVTVLLIVGVTTPLVILGMLKVWPHTPIGRRMLNRRPGERAADPPKRTTSRGTPLEQLVGRIGIAKTDLLPSGQIVIDDEKIDAVSIGMPIDRGSEIIVCTVDTGRVRVRTALPEELDAAKPDAQSLDAQSLDAQSLDERETEDRQKVDRPLEAELPRSVPRSPKSLEQPLDSFDVE